MKAFYAKWAAVKHSTNFRVKDIFSMNEILCVNTIQKPVKGGVVG
jgi:hypothetical protein